MLTQCRLSYTSLPTLLIIGQKGMQGRQKALAYKKECAS